MTINRTVNSTHNREYIHTFPLSKDVLEESGVISWNVLGKVAIEVPAAKLNGMIPPAFFALTFANCYAIGCFLT